MRPRLLIFGVASLAVAALAWRDQAVGYWVAMGPDSAPGPIRGDPRIALGRTDIGTTLTEGPAAGAAPAIVTQARAVLRQTPLDAAALRDLALASREHDDPAFARRLALAERISRRDQPTETALLQRAAEGGDYRSSMVHLDRILTVNPGAIDTFGDAMVGLVSDSQGRRVLAAYRSRPWYTDFAQLAIDQSEDPQDAVKLLTEGGGPSPRDRASLMSRLVKRLAGARQFAAARQFAISFGHVRPAQLDDFRPATANPSLAPLTWQLPNNGDVQTSLDASGGLEVEVRPGALVAILDRVTLLPPGRYAFEQEIEPVDADSKLDLRWEVTCPMSPGTAPVWEQPVPLRSDHKRYRSAVLVPSTCPVQRWRLLGLADETQMAVSLRIPLLRLAAIGGPV